MKAWSRCAAVAAIVAAAVIAVAGVAQGGGTRPARAGGAEARGAAVTFLRDVVGRLAANRYAEAWSTLVPDQQRLVPRDTYVRCESLSPVPGRLAAITALSVREERVQVPGAEDGSLPSVVVVFRLRIVDDTAGFSTAVRVTAHALRRDGRWAWMLPAERLEQHRTPGCGVAPVGDPASAV